ncbi:uncharacterized protein PV07_09646 [Cladophialophora immunda]|uniref:Uncharacterized protein n=1 Tax=Cladophialophora immunda TaxID=569365 RepID=A0A0D2C7X0_9EURO|nr:uncharacterized protein PV07_09646 [Cladophialophora immunda]KIW26560.1 hypothetical protein PV07_09646 [Cladophialophora immunda]
MYDEGVRLGGGTEAQREGARRFMEEWKMYSYQMVKAQVDLVGDSGNGNGSILFRELMDWGHDSPMRNPELLARDMALGTKHGEEDEDEDEAASAVHVTKFLGESSANGTSALMSLNSQSNANQCPIPQPAQASIR